MKRCIHPIICGAHWYDTRQGADCARCGRRFAFHASIIRDIIRVVVFFLFLVACGLIVGILDPAHAQEHHTAMWYVGHPADMRSMLLACRNDPGRAKLTPECENVTEAQEIIAAAQAQAHVRDMTPPSNPRYWRLHPDELPQKVFACQHVAPQYRHALWCDSAQAAMEKGK